MRDAGILTGAAVAISDERIAAVGTQHELERDFPDAERVDCTGCVLTPGLIDSHTHAVFGRARHEEQELRAQGRSYMEIAESGGGIHASVRDFRARGEQELYALSRARLTGMASYGATTVEIKSGYGLTLEDELKALRIVHRLQQELPLRIVPTWLGAHEIPLEFRQHDGRAAYIELLIRDVLPAVAADRLALFADVFCEPGVFTPREARAILTAARNAGLGVKLHADEFENSGGAQLAVELGATSADHLGAVSNEGIAALAGSETVATLLPGTLLFLGRPDQAPARAGHPARAALERALRAPALTVSGLCDCLRAAGDDAAGEGHGWGARALLQASYELALEAGCLCQAARAAGSMAVVVEARHLSWSMSARVGTHVQVPD
jgi:imidazolonepropionase